MTSTPRHNFQLPVIGGSANNWGQILNNNWNELDQLLETKAAIINFIYPVGSVIVRADTVDPSTYLPNTTWVQTARGRAVVGEGVAGGATRALGDKFGSNAVTLGTIHLPAHTHSSGTLTTSSAGQHDHQLSYDTIDREAGDFPTVQQLRSETSGDIDRTTTEEGAHTHSISGNTGSTGQGDAHENTQPSQVFYVWQRTA